MLHTFHTYVASVLNDIVYVLQWFSSVFQVFLHVFQQNVSSVSYAFRRMLHLNVLKVNRVLHLSHHFSATSPRCLLLL
jgi:hypothetical protein